jgi:hypothetical protein
VSWLLCIVRLERVCRVVCSLQAPNQKKLMRKTRCRVDDLNRALILPTAWEACSNNFAAGLASRKYFAFTVVKPRRPEPRFAGDCHTIEKAYVYVS